MEINRLNNMLEKYKDELKIGTYLAIKAEIDRLEKIIESDRRIVDYCGECEKEVEYWRTQVSDLMNASFAEKFKFLFKDTKSEI